MFEATILTLFALSIATAAYALFGAIKDAVAAYEARELAASVRIRARDNGGRYMGTDRNGFTAIAA